MFVYAVILVFILGTVIGSFLNVLILRHGEQTVTGRSECPSCKKKLEWFELIPVLSFVIQGAKCRSCKNPISWQYPIVEVATGIVFVGILFFLADFYRISDIYGLFSLHLLTSFLFLMVIWGLLIAIFVYDLYHKIIPDQFVFPFIAVSLVWLFHFADGGKLFSLPYFWDFFMGPLLFLFFASLWYFSKGTWMGFGDAKLALGMGFLLGFSKGLMAFMFSFWIGAIVAVIFLLVNKLSFEITDRYFPENFKKLTIKSEVPFAPFLIIGTALAFFLDFEFIIVTSLFF